MMSDAEMEFTAEEFAAIMRVVDDPRTPYSSFEEFLFDSTMTWHKLLTDPEFVETDNVFLMIPDEG